MRAVVPIGSDYVVFSQFDPRVFVDFLGVTNFPGAMLFHDVLRWFCGWFAKVKACVYNGWVTTPTSDLPRPTALLPPALLGTACCLVSALGYTAANICLRRLAVDCDAAWVTCVKASVAALLVCPWLLYRTLGCRAAVLPLKAFAFLVLLGLIGQFGGNLNLQFALATLGLTITIPTVFGLILVASAVLGRLVLGERVSRRSVGAIGILIGAMVLLGLGAGAANQSVGEEGRAMVGPTWVALGIGAACLSGVCYACLSTGIRRVVSPAVPPAWVVFVTTSVGMVTMGAISVYRLGIPRLLDTRADDLGFMLAAGFFNLVAYLALARGLQSTALIRVNVLNASQVAMCGVAGLLLFGEPPSWFLLLGVGMTIVGMTFIDRPSEAAEL